MGSDKFFYQEPKRSREHLEAISFQLRGTAKGDKAKTRPATIQDHLADLVSLAREAAWQKKREPLMIQIAETSALYALAVICGLLTWYGSGHAASGWDWLDEHRFALKTWGVALSAVFVGIHVERTGLANVAWRYSVTKFLASVWLFRTLDDAQLPTKVYQLARVLDFNGKHTCTNLPQGASVVFIGPDQNKVLIDSNSQATPGLEEFFGREASGWETPPERFAVTDCRVAPAP